MARPDPIEYAERLYSAIRAANFSPLSFLAFGNAVKDGIAMRNMPRIAVEPFMRVVGEMLDLVEMAASSEVVDATITDTRTEQENPEEHPALVETVDAATSNVSVVEEAAAPEKSRRRK
jgi:hypothetical protein